MWLLGFEPRSPRPQRGILTTKLQPLCAHCITYLLIIIIITSMIEMSCNIWGTYGTLMEIIL